MGGRPPTVGRNMSDRLCLLTVHAHPDDEASKGAATVARYHDEGVRTVLVCCAGGEAGEIRNPAMDRPEIVERLSDVRREELAQSVAIIGYDEVVLLGYRDSGMPGTPFNEDPQCFACADFEEAIGRLVAVIRREKPQVIITYPDEQAGYPHPDHLRVHDITLPAFDAAGDPDAYPEAGDPWQPLKLYYSACSPACVTASGADYVVFMPKYLTQEWLDTQRDIAQEFPERPGATAHLQYVVTGAPDGDVRYFWVVDSGKLLQDELGEDPDAEVV